MRFPGIKVGDKVGVRSENPNALRYYRYEHASVLEVSDDSFRLKWGWFRKEDGRSGTNVVVSVEELTENNAAFYRERSASRLRAEIAKGLCQLGTSPADLVLF